MKGKEKTIFEKENQIQIIQNLNHNKLSNEVCVILGFTRVPSDL